jgi:hypothetical protein
MSKDFLFLNPHTDKTRIVKANSKKRAIELNSLVGKGNFKYVTKKEYDYLMSL